MYDSETCSGAIPVSTDIYFYRSRPVGDSGLDGGAEAIGLEHLVERRGVGFR